MLFFQRSMVRWSLGLIGAVLLFLMNGCASTRAFREGEKAYRQKEIDLAVEYYVRALQHSPDNVRYRFALSNAMVSSSTVHARRGDEFQSAGDTKMALMEYQKALEMNADNQDARRKMQRLAKQLEEERRNAYEKTDIERMKEQANLAAGKNGEKLEAAGKLLDLKLGEQELKVLFKTVIQRQAGIRILLDPDFQSKKVSVDFEKVTLAQLIDYLMMQTKNFYKVVDPQTIIVAPDTQNKRREYEELVMRTFFLSNAEPGDMQKVLQTLAGIKVMTVDTRRNAITVRDKPETMKLAEKIISIYDRSRGEVLVDVEVIEVNKNRLKQYGIELSQYQVAQAFNPGPLPDSTQAGSSWFRGNIFSHINAADFIFSLPSVAYRLMREDVKSNIKARPQLRMLDREKSKILLGDKVPIPTTTFVPNYGTSVPGALNQNPITSFNLQDVGMTIEMTPQVHHDGWVTLNLKFELNFITVAGTSTMPPTIGNRSVETVIRLRDSETGLIAGLLRDSERDSLKGFPVLSDIPVLREIFSANKDESEQTDIILTITPRIIQYPQIEESDLETYWVGTEERPGLRRPPPVSPMAGKSTEPEEKVKDPAARKGIEKAPEPIARETGMKAGGAEAKAAEPATKPTIVGEPASGPIAPLKATANIPLEPPKPETVRFYVGDPPGELAQNSELIMVWRAEGIPDLSLLDLELSYPVGLLEMRTIEISRDLQQVDPAAHLFKTFDNAAGRARVSLTAAPSGAVSRRGLVQLVFKTRGAGSGQVKVERIRWLDSRQREIEVRTEAVPVQVRETKTGKE